MATNEMKTSEKRTEGLHAAQAKGDKPRPWDALLRLASNSNLSDEEAAEFHKAAKSAWGDQVEHNPLP